MKQKRSKRIRRRAVLLAAVLLLAAGIGGVALAQFTLSHRAKRVIAANGDTEQLFSSNFMQENADPIVRRTKYTSDDGTVTVDVTVCNYAQGNPNTTYNGPITYKLTARIVGPNQAAAYVPTEQNEHLTITKGGVSFNLDTTNALFSDQTLAAGTHRTDTYVLSLPASFCGSGYYVELIAVPTAQDLKTISVWLNLQKHVGEAQSAWSLYLSDPIESGATNIGDFSGFNFQLRGSGAGTVTLSWDNTLLELSKVFQGSISGLTVTTNGTTSQIQIPVDSTVKNSYDIQFYRAGGAIASKEALLSAVSCTFAATPVPTPTPTPTEAPSSP